MIKKILFLIYIFIFTLGISSVGNTYSVDYNYNISGNEFVSPYSNSSFWIMDFNDWEGAYDTNWAVVSGSQVGAYAAPMGVTTQNTSPYLTVPKDLSSYNSFDSDITNFRSLGSFNYFGIWWGSIDKYNTLDFYNNDTLIATFTGADVSLASNGNWTDSGTNKYVNIFFDEGLFNRFILSSSQYAFEADNITVGVVPEPATILLLGLGLLSISGLKRKV